MQPSFSDFGAAYMAVRNLRANFRTPAPGRSALARPEDFALMARVLDEGWHAEQTQSRLLYREAAQSLAGLCADTGSALAIRGGETLRRLLESPLMRVRQAAAAALGSLPVEITPPPAPEPLAGNPPRLGPDEIARMAGLERLPDFSRAGRSLLATMPDGRLLVIKIASAAQAPNLHLEAYWIRRLARESFPCPCEHPLPLEDRPDPRRTVFIPEALPGDPDTERVAIAFSAPANYFRYLNDHGPGRLPDAETFADGLTRAARLLGHLAGRGIVHADPIPLFHNRTQQARRNDAGRYDWTRRGRLDRWLDSCLHPNLALCGLRDFEHLEPCGPGPGLFRAVGDHLLSLALVIGSYFRCRDLRLRGTGPGGEPADARGLFDRPLLARLLDDAFAAYHLGFAGRPGPKRLPWNASELAERMTHEMGLDRHMDEILRVADQETMTDDEFQRRLIAAGLPREQALSAVRGRENVALPCGPHLGRFNGACSLPELLDYVEQGAALCTAGRFAASRT